MTSKTHIQTTGKTIYLPDTPEHKRNLDDWRDAFFGQVVTTEDYLTVDPNCGVAKVRILPGAQVVGTTATASNVPVALVRVPHGGPMPYTLHKLQGDGIYMVVRFVEDQRIEGWFTINDGHIFYSKGAPDLTTMMLDAVTHHASEN